MKPKKPIVFCDFDGTFAEKDIGHRVFRHFSGGRNMELVRKWKAGEISSRQCLSEEAAMIKVTSDEFYEYIEQFNLRKGAVELYVKLKACDIPFYIVSDGADIYIKYLLEKNGLSEITVFSNRATISGNEYRMEFPYDNDGCSRCGSCKGARIKEVVSGNRDEYDIVFIGDGLSDICAVPEADRVFARGDLLEFCNQNGINAIEYEDFFDILNMLEKSGFIPRC
jgi:2,3-diketo-5-methylthio-1-phosphopentane phosphatase